MPDEETNRTLAIVVFELRRSQSAW